MNQNAMILSALPEVDFHIHHVDIDSTSPLNHHELHSHQECEIYINLTGNVSFEVEGRIYPVSRGSVIITRPYEYHHCIYHSNALHLHYWITFSADHADEYLKLFFNREKGIGNHIFLDEEALTELCDTLDRLLSKQATPLLQRICFLQMIHILTQGKQLEAPGSQTEIPADVLQALSFMDSHFTEDISVQTLSEVSGVSINTLERHFKETLNTSPSVMLRLKRLYHSMSCLRSGLAVSEAALKSGFPDYSNYIYCFRRQFGITPLKYQKQFQPKP